jgi:NADPH:quinone reductase-like Zn-dependent oxidoreductase
VHAASLNYRDLITVNMGVSHELIPLSDGAGVVEDVGEQVVQLKKGDRVVGLSFRSGKVAISMPTSLQQPEVVFPPTACLRTACMVLKTVL